ncbi:ABC-type Na+ efflux pump, permease component [Halorubrum ezzemoulense]|uniref:ABC-type Na+ efflux pump, permease component n=1 Tax=Halorubrum ezzemoulense TaxID=337243 RepID=A0A238USM9_HALEZ|nr:MULTISPECIES: ABC transporter permease [Halorubrum]TKX39804.1 ABC transporter permease [Halorubrum sp. CGM4_25_10-8A]TKX65112.1 ABC transporter permease [Halorubrum sp. GN12_10-3_MGM]SNR25048.1 ABC-type Na+ efflux pump, permease component [Halorubrum ezzemoulense]
MDSRLTIAGQELAGLRAEKTILLAIGIQLFIAAFSSFLVVGLVSMYDPGALDGAQIEVAAAGDAVDDLERAASEVPGASVTPYDDADAARSAFERNAADAVVATRTESGRVSAAVTAPDATVETTVIVVQLRELLRTYELNERERRASYLEESPLPLPDRSDTSPYFTFTYTVLIPLLVFLPVFISGSLVVDSITEELDQGTMELLRVAPVTLAEIVDGKAAAAIGIAPAQALLWLLLLEANGTAVANVGPILALMTALTTLVVAVAVGIAAVAPDRRAAQLLYSVAVLVLFGGATAMAGGPANAVARLAIDSAGATTGVLVVAYAAIAAAAYLGVRRVVSVDGLGR